MPTHPFASFVLRTLDPVAATAFYDAVLGHCGDAVFELHENARANGARPHWLGCIHTTEPDAMAASLLADGGQRLGPRPGGGVVLRDPGGALLAVGPVGTPSVAGVLWHVLRSREADRAMDRYARVFGWALGAWGGPDGDFRSFAWTEGEPTVGAIAGVEHTPGVHPQWLHFFGVESFDGAIDTARELGATLLPAGSMPSGRRYAVVDDPQGAAFGLMERPGREEKPVRR